MKKTYYTIITFIIIFFSSVVYGNDEFKLYMPLDNGDDTSAFMELTLQPCALPDEVARLYPHRGVIINKQLTDAGLVGEVCWDTKMPEEDSLADGRPKVPVITVYATEHYRGNFHPKLFSKQKRRWDDNWNPYMKKDSDYHVRYDGSY